MIYLLIILLIVKCIDTSNLTNFNQINDDSNQIDKRAVMRDLKYKWSNNIVIFYVHYQLEQSAIFLAHAMIQKKTCLRFFKTNVPKNAQLIYIAGTMYLTYLGKQNRSAHKIFLPKANLDPGKTARETLRALGFDYEHNRPERDKYLKVMMSNIPKKFWLFFLKESSKNVNTFGLGYDYRSIMHFGPRELCENGKKCMRTRRYDRLIESAMGKASKLTFNDAKLVNLKYCLSLIAVRRGKCLHYGYPESIIPTQCVCLRYFTGSKCQYFTGNHVDCNQQNIFYASRETNRINLIAKKNCFYLFKASEGRRIKFSIKFSRLSHCYNICNDKEHVEVRYRNDISVSGSMICPRLFTYNFKSESNLVILHTKFVTRSYKLKVFMKEI